MNLPSLTLKTSTRASFWLQTASRSMRKINILWWLNYFIPSLLAISILASSVLLFFRSSNISLSTFWLIYCGLILCTAAICLSIAKQNFLNIRKTIDLLDLCFGFKNELSSAYEGAINWPTPRPLKTWASIKWAKIVPPLCLSVTAIIIAYYIPLSSKATYIQKKINPPSAAIELNNWIESLKDKDSINQNALEKISTQLQNLMNQDVEKWYSHHNLEALDTLKQATKTEIENLASNTKTASHALSTLTKNWNSLSDTQKTLLKRRVIEALKKLQQNALFNNSMSLLETIEKSFSSENHQKLAETAKQLKLDSAMLGESLNKSSQTTTKDLQAKQNGKSNNETARIPQQNSLAKEANAEEISQMADNWLQQEKKRTFNPHPLEKQGGSYPNGQGNSVEEGHGIVRGPGQAPLGIHVTPKGIAKFAPAPIKPPDSVLDDPNARKRQVFQLPQITRDPVSNKHGKTQAQLNQTVEAWRYTFSPEEQKLIKKYFQ